MKQGFMQSCTEVVEVSPRQIICASANGWAEMSGYGEDAGDGFTQLTD